MCENSDVVSVDQAIEVLNRALAADRKGISALFEMRVLVNEKLAMDPTIQVVVYEDIVQWGPLGLERKRDTLGPLGLLNGIFGIREDGWGNITMSVDEDTGLVQSFYKTREDRD